MKISYPRLKNTLAIVVGMIFCAFVHANEIVTIDCAVSGTDIYSQRIETKITERIVYEAGVTSGGFKFSKTEFFTGGKKTDAKIISKTDASLLSVASMPHGKGYGKKVYLLSNFYDFEAQEMTRLLITLPGGEVEKTIGRCSHKTQRK